MQAIKELSFVWARQQKRAFPATQEAMKVQGKCFDLQDVEEPREISWAWVIVVVVTSAQWQHFYCQHICTKVQKRESRRMRFSPLRDAKWLISGAVGALVIPCSSAHHYQCAVEFLCCQWLCARVCELLSSRKGDILINHTWLWSLFC